MSQTPLKAGGYYHVYNRGVNSAPIFFEKRNYSHFLKLYAHHVGSTVDTFAYALLPTHFHLALRVKSLQEQEEEGSAEPLDANEAFRRFFISYVKSINRVLPRRGPLFEGRLQRCPVDSRRYFMNLILYIHQNAVRHGYVDEPEDWPHSSYRTLALTAPTQLRREDILRWFEGPQRFREAHATLIDPSDLVP